MKIVILAGGSGTRLWPKSRKNNPKQFIEVVNNVSMIENTYERLMGFFDPKDIYFSTIPDFAGKIKEIFPQTPDDHIIIEPEKRDNAAAHGFVAATFLKDSPDEPLAFIPSDHYIRDVVKFNTTLKVAETLIRETGKMLDIAIDPTFPSTALGYTRIGEQVRVENGVEAFSFKGHTEKPEFSVAKEYLQEGSYLWHGNYYMWTPRGFMEAYKKYAPGIHEHLVSIVDALEQKNDDAIKEAYSQIEKTSIDFAITEKMNHEDVLILKGDFGWSDIGAWDVLCDLKKGEQDEKGNLIEADWVGVDTSGSYVSAPEGKMVATIGMHDVVVIDTKDALLVCPKGKAQDVKKVIEKMREQGDIEYL